jgi:hypothetical protein
MTSKTVRACLALPLLGLPLLPLAVSETACKNGVTPGQESVITSAIAGELECVANAALTGGLTDATAIAAQCGGITVNAVVAIVESFLSTSAAGDGGPALAAARKIGPLRVVFNFSPSDLTTFSKLDQAWRAAGLTPAQ